MKLFARWSIALLLLVVIGVLCFRLTDKQDDKLASFPHCQSHISVINHQQELSLMLLFSEKRDQSMVELHGFYTDGHSEEKILHRTVLFTATRTASGVVLLSENVRKHSNENVEEKAISGLLPGFFRNEGRELTLQVKKLNTGDWVFFQSGLPVYYCYKS